MRQKAFFKEKKFGFFRCFRFSTLDWNGRKLNFFSKLPENIMVDRTANNWIFHPIKIR